MSYETTGKDRSRSRDRETEEETDGDNAEPRDAAREQRVLIDTAVLIPPG